MKAGPQGLVRTASTRSGSHEKRLSHMKTALSLLPLLAAISLSSCETPGQTALLGAGIGALSGHHTVRNAAIGAGAGYLVGKIAQVHRREHGYDDEVYGRRYPYGRLTD